MKLNFRVVRGYVSWLTEGRGASDPNAGNDWDLFAADIDDMVREARQHGDEAILRSAIVALATAGEAELRPFYGQVRSWNDEQLTDLLAHAHRHLWAQDVPVGFGPRPQIVPMSDEEWAQHRSQLQ